ACSSRLNSSSPFSVSWVSASEVTCRSPSLPEREIESLKQRARFFVVLGRRADRDVHPERRLDLVVVDLGEDQVLLDADRVVAAAVEALRMEPAEVAYTRQRDVHEPVEEFVHAGTAQRDLAADRLVLAQLEGRDRLARMRHDRLLSGDRGEIRGGEIDLLA